MPSLLHKLSYFDPATGGTFVISDDSFIWKEGKKAPEASKVTRLVQRYGWNLRSGDDIWLVFRQKGNRGELVVVRGSKIWLYGLPNHDVIMKGEGLDSLYDALEKGMLVEPSAKATTGSKLLQARETMHDDSGALTGLRSRPDYGESDSYTSEMNEANSKGACLVLSGSVKTASGTQQAELYVTAVEYERGCAFKLASFQYSPDPVQAKVFGRYTAENLVRQIRGLCGAMAKAILAKSVV